MEIVGRSLRRRIAYPGLLLVLFVVINYVRSLETWAIVVLIPVGVFLTGSVSTSCYDGIPSDRARAVERTNSPVVTGTDTDYCNWVPAVRRDDPVNDWY